MEDRYEPLFPPPPTSGNEYDDSWLQLSCLMPHTESIHFPTTTCQPYINISRLTIGRQRSIKPRYSLSLQYLTREAFAPEKQKRLSGVLVHHFVLPPAKRPTIQAIPSFIRLIVKWTVCSRGARCSFYTPLKQTPTRANF